MHAVHGETLPVEGVAIKVRLSVAWPDGDLFGAGLRPHCPVDAAPRTSLRRSQQNHQRAPEFRIGKSTPRRAIRPTKLPPEPEEQADSERMSHRAHMGLCRRVGSRRRPSVHLPCFSSAATYRSPGGSDGIGLQCVGSNSTSTLAVDIQRPCCHCPACQPACSGQKRRSVFSSSLGAVSIG